MKNKHIPSEIEEKIVDPFTLTEHLLSCLNEREKEVLKRRHALYGNKKATLEEIGGAHGITRERVRQIERATIQKIKRLIEYRVALQTLTAEVDHILTHYGGMVAHHHLIDELARETKELIQKEQEHARRQHIIFLLEHFMTEFFHFHPEHDVHHEGWSKDPALLESVRKSIKEIKEYVLRHGLPLTHEEIAKALDKNTNAVYSHLQLSKELEQDPFGLWGHATWRVVKPKRMADRIFVVLKKYGVPLHFKEIAAYIGKHYGKQTHAPTVHNELIADPRFVLVGRGIYALKEWGYETGTVKDVVERIVQKCRKPVTREDIITLVQKDRLVARSTILLALNNSQKIKKVGPNLYASDISQGKKIPAE